MHIRRVSNFHGLPTKMIKNMSEQADMTGHVKLKNDIMTLLINNINGEKND
jgi:hypothetical protein